ncbi:YitT family protein [Bacillus sp. RG28]|uniref:YitT family protein n=2 Tax=Gottfriedia endophytica TaxID=2820819 RepID=A0A940NPE5_9BACI|nr:YitT family protein [Gottfriedia endophytica]
MAICLKAFFIPTDIIDGGIVGISLILSHLTSVELGIFLFVLNLPFVLVGYKQIGKTFAFSTLLGISLMSVFTSLFSNIKPVTTDPLLAAIFGGMGVGIGVGLVIRYGGSLDGTEIIAILLNKKTPFSVGEVVMTFNVFILGSAGFVFGWDKAMYSLIAYYIAFKTIDLTIEGFQDTKSVWIISDHDKEIGDALNDRLGRGVTYLHGEGGFNGDPKNVVFTVISRLEEAKLKAIVEDIDDHAFVAIGNIADVKGGKFKKKAIH